MIKIFSFFLRPRLFFTFLRNPVRRCVPRMWCQMPFCTLLIQGKFSSSLWKLFRQQMISAVAETSEASIEEIKFHIQLFKVTKFSKEWKIGLKMHFLVFAPFVGNFSNKHHYNLPKVLRIFCFWYFCPKWLFPKLFVLKVDLRIKVVALIKITTVYL